MKDLVIVGYGGLAREVAFLVGELNRQGPKWNVLGYVSATRAEVGRPEGNSIVCGDDAWLEAHPGPIAVVLGVGTPGLIEKLHLRFSANHGIEFPRLIHPSTTGDWGQITWGAGNIVLNGVAFTTDISIGSGNVFNPGCTVAHDCRIGSYNLFGPGVHLAGGVTIGSRVLVGVGANVLPGVSICDGVVVGGGAAVVRDITQPGTYVGVPARRVDAGATKSVSSA